MWVISTFTSPRLRCRRTLAMPSSVNRMCTKIDVPLGRPKCEHRMTFAPCSNKNLVVGTTERKRVSSVTVTSSCQYVKKSRRRMFRRQRKCEKSKNSEKRLVLHPILTRHTYLGKRNIQVHTNKNVLPFQVDLISESFDIEFGVCGGSNVKGSLEGKVGKLHLRSYACGAEKKRTEHCINKLICLLYYCGVVAIWLLDKWIRQEGGRDVVIRRKRKKDRGRSNERQPSHRHLRHHS